MASTITLNGTVAATGAPGFAVPVLLRQIHLETRTFPKLAVVVLVALAAHAILPQLTR